jgi:hypothetical protein
MLSSTSNTFEPNELSQWPLLSSIYSEILRLYSGVFLIVASPPGDDVPLGPWKFPSCSLGMVSSAVAHTDESVWNTKDGAYPLDTFWADRFLIYPEDVTSGPIRPEARAARTSKAPKKQEAEFSKINNETPRYSTEGLEGSWIPYGGKLCDRHGTSIHSSRTDADKVSLRYRRIWHMSRPFSRQRHDHVNVCFAGYGEGRGNPH